jgi:hypothetical protein
MSFVFRVLLSAAIIVTIGGSGVLAGPPRVRPPITLDEILLYPETPEEETVVSFQLAACVRGSSPSASRRLVLALWRLEGILGVPREARGLLGAVWCWETGFSTEPPVGDNGRSHGPFQMMGWFWNWCGHPIGRPDGTYLPPKALRRTTHDIVLAASCYWARVKHYLDDGLCPGNVWRAEAMAAHGPKYKSKGCAAESLHSLELTRWKMLAVQAAQSAPDQPGPRGTRPLPDGT